MSMKPRALQTKIFLDSGDALETKRAIDALGFLDGQTTNPSLVVQNPRIQDIIQSGRLLSQSEALDVYKTIIQDISGLIPHGSVSIEVPVETEDTVEMLTHMGKEMFAWIPNAHIKYPLIPRGIDAAQRLVSDGMRVNMTLCFTQEQAAIVHMATRGAHKGDVFVSPFLGRLHDLGLNDTDLIQNCQDMFAKNQSHVEILAASIRDIEHFMQMLSLKVDCITAPLHVLESWAQLGMPLPDTVIQHATDGFAPIPAKDIDLSGDWHDISSQHSLTDAGMIRFQKDWRTLTETPNQ